jgi:hypothetical protein
VAGFLRELTALFKLAVDPQGFKKAERDVQSLKDSSTAALANVGAGALAGIGEAGRDGVSALSQLKGALLGVGAVAVGAKIVRELRSVVDEVSQTSSQLRRMSLETGESMHTLEGWGYAAERNGAKLDDVGAAISNIAAKQLQLSHGSKGAAIALGGLSIKGKTASDVLENLADKVTQLQAKGTAATKIAAMVSEVTGSTALLPLLSQGSKAIRDMRAELDAFGVNAERDANSAALYRAELVRMNLVFTGLKQSVAGPLMQAWGDINREFNEFVKADKGKRVEGVRKGFEQLYHVQRRIADAMKLIFVAGTFLGKHIELVGILGASLAAITLGMTLFGGASLSAGLMAAGGAAVAFAKWLLLGALLATFVLVINSIWRALKGQDSLIGDLFDKGMKYLESWSQDFGDSWILKQLNQIAKFWTSEGGLRGGVRAFVQEAKDLLDGLARWFEQRWAPIRAFFSTIGNAASKVGNFVAKPFRDYENRDDVKAIRSVESLQDRFDNVARGTRSGQGNTLSGLFRPTNTFNINGVQDPTAVSTMIARKLREQEETAAMSLDEGVSQ